MASHKSLLLQKKHLTKSDMYNNYRSVVINIRLTMTYMLAKMYRMPIRSCKKATHALSTVLMFPSPGEDILKEILNFGLLDKNSALVIALDEASIVIEDTLLAVVKLIEPITEKLFMKVYKYNKVYDHLVTVIPKDNLVKFTERLVYNGHSINIIEKLLQVCEYDTHIIDAMLNADEQYLRYLLDKGLTVNLQRASFKSLYMNVTSPQVKEFLLSKGLLDYSIFYYLRGVKAIYHAPTAIKKIIEVAPEWNGLQEELTLLYAGSDLIDVIVALDEASKIVNPTKKLYDCLPQTSSMYIINKFLDFFPSSDIVYKLRFRRVTDLTNNTIREFVNKCFVKNYTMINSLNAWCCTQRLCILEGCLPKELILHIASFML